SESAELEEIPCVNLICIPIYRKENIKSRQTSNKNPTDTIPLLSYKPHDDSYTRDHPGQGRDPWTRQALTRTE
ncbi:hypothetical protein COV05_04700, partial [Candidatus Uhrbacteria bacterium CG10_big_fil_rev_8_21_14_0_10_48_16]